MKNAQTATPNRDALLDYIQRLTPAQCEKLVKRLSLLKQLAGMTDKVCGKVSA